MKVIKSIQAEEFKNNDACTAFEYHLDDKEINVAVIKLDGRYPEKGRVMNTLCKELSYILKGTGKLFLEDQIIDVDEGDVVMIEPGEKYYWEGTMTMFVPCVPAWTKEQHKIVD